jgi:hypothetical protein
VPVSRERVASYGAQAWLGSNARLASKNCEKCWQRTSDCRGSHAALNREAWARSCGGRKHRQRSKRIRRARTRETRGSDQKHRVAQVLDETRLAVPADSGVCSTFRRTKALGSAHNVPAAFHSRMLLRAVLLLRNALNMPTTPRQWQYRGHARHMATLKDKLTVLRKRLEPNMRLR